MKYPILYHYSSDVNTPVPYYTAQELPPFPYKPMGIWLTPDVEANWEEWCRAEEFNLQNLRFRHRMTIKDDANVLWITNANELDSFTKRFESKPPFGDTVLRGYIDWQTVCSQYEGILITPYLWERRLHPNSHWYYGWDCASACIWTPHVFDRIERDSSYTDRGQFLIT